MSIAHYIASGMGGIRTAGDLVARMEYAKNMKIDDAKKYVADKLGLDTFQISDEEVMREVRAKEQISVVTGVPGVARGLISKMNIEKILGIKINSCEHFRSMMS